MNLGPTELLIILGIMLLLFGSTKLPKLARSLGDAKREFEKSVDEEPSHKAVTPSSQSSKEEELRLREEAVRRREDEARRTGGETS